MSMRLRVETLLLVGVILALFLLALVCLAISLNGGRGLFDGSLFRRCFCCRCGRRRQREEVDEEQSPPSYETLNEFVFESEGSGVLASNDDMPTTMQQLFPDLLAGSSENDGRGVGGSSSGFYTSGMNNKNNKVSVSIAAGGENHAGIDGKDKNTNAELREPLL
mmetsp:Transcript_28799/g.54142  ORF Transcript_28799/g.54142 Transcript_28799/m.54142 type:complete len:164 (+) Transcript_28799:180-671(+)